MDKPKVDFSGFVFSKEDQPPENDEQVLAKAIEMYKGNTALAYYLHTDYLVYRTRDNLDVLDAWLAALKDVVKLLEGKDGLNAPAH